MDHGKKSRRPETGYHILVIPSWFPTPADPFQGTFCLDHVRAVKGEGHMTGVLFPALRNLNKLRRWQDFRDTRFHFSVHRTDGIPLYLFSGWALPKTLVLQHEVYLFAVQRMYKAYIRRFGVPDLIHAHGALWGGCGAAALGKRHRIPWVVTEHYGAFLRGSVKKRERHLARQVWQNAARTTAVGSHLAGFISRQTNRQAIAVTPNPVDMALFSSSRPDRGDTQYIHLFALGGLEPGKGFRSLLNSFAMAFKDKRQYRLEIGGQGRLLGELRLIAADLGIARQIVFSGPLTRPQVAQAFGRADFFVHASPSETFGVVMLEALASGIPVVAVRSGGPDDFITEDCGFLVPPGDAKALASKMRQVADELPRWKARRENIRCYAGQGYGYPAVGRMFTRIYDQILENTGNRGTYK